MNLTTTLGARAIGVMRTQGPQEAARRVSRYAYRRLHAGALDTPLLDGDIADSRSLRLALPPERPGAGRPLRIGWVLTPPAAGSGGHTTLFRMVEEVERAGHSCTLFLYDRHHGDLGAHESTIRRWWPQLRADVRDAQAGVDGVDAAVASSWESAHVMATKGLAPMRRLYFVQDFEPYFYPRGAAYALAEDSYRFGFRCIALGSMVGDLLRREVGIDPDVTEFGCDGAVYRDLGGERGTDVVLYARPDVPRRGFWLARLALEEFHRRHPDAVIHVFGDEVPELDFPAQRHGRLTPTEINRLYNRCAAGIAMSFTNISLAAEEMLSAGTIPVVNDSPLARSDLGNPYVQWAAPTPTGIADGLTAAITRTGRDEHARAAAASTRRAGWSTAAEDVRRIIENEVYGS